MSIIKSFITGLAEGFVEGVTENLQNSRKTTKVEKLEILKEIVECYEVVQQKLKSPEDKKMILKEVTIEHPLGFMCFLELIRTHKNWDYDNIGGTIYPFFLEILEISTHSKNLHKNFELLIKTRIGMKKLLNLKDLEPEFDEFYGLSEAHRIRDKLNIIDCILLDGRLVCIIEFVIDAMERKYGN